MNKFLKATGFWTTLMGMILALGGAQSFSGTNHAIPHR